MLRRAEDKGCAGDRLSWAELSAAILKRAARATTSGDVT